MGRSTVMETLHKSIIVDNEDILTNHEESPNFNAP